jgi:2-aminoethylphosphonate transport system substrate-binding protein
MKLRSLAAVAAALSLSVGLAACSSGSGSSNSGSSGSSGSSAGGGGSKTVTVYSADGLADWYKPEFAAFTKQTGIKVQYVEDGSSGVVSRVEKERANPQADVLVTLPPFIQQADADGMLTSFTADTSTVAAADKSADWSALVDNYACFIVGSKVSPAPKTWTDLLSPTYKGKLQYSTPGQAGDGTAVLVLLQHEMGKSAAIAYLKKLQANNVGPSSSTGDLQPKVSTGQLDVANGDVQMNLASINNDKSKFTVFFPSNGTAAPETLALPYDIGLVKGAPHGDNGQKLANFLLSATAQKQVSSLAFGLPVRSDVQPTDMAYTKIESAIKGVKIYIPNWNDVLKSLNADVTTYTNAVGS